MSAVDIEGVQVNGDAGERQEEVLSADALQFVARLQRDRVAHG